jgi:hypothetical protein
MAIDGTVFDVPDRPATAEAFGRPTGGRGDGAFPQVRKVSLVEVGTHVEVALVCGALSEGEQTLARRLFDQVPADALLTEDRGFFGYEDWKALISRKIQLLVRVKKSLVLQRVRELPDGSYVAKISPTDYARKKDRDGIEVRVIEYTLDDPQRTGHGQTHRLITTLVNPLLYAALDLIVGDHERWEIELVFDEQKTHQDPVRAEKPANLRSETPDGVRQELYALSLAHFVVRALMVEAARPLKLDPDRLSFTGCFRVLKCRLPECRLPECRPHTPQAFADWYAALIWELQHEQLPPRRNRINPRVIKRKMSKWPKKRAKHKFPSRLSKHFTDTVVMAN